jgi:hypothetical protein
MYPLSVKENLCRWRCLMPDACIEGQQFLAFRRISSSKAGGPPWFSIASRQTLRDSGNHYISSDPTRLWDPQRLARPYETLGTTTSRQTLRDSGSQKVWSDPSKLCEPYTVPTEEGFLGDVFEHRKRLRPLGREPSSCAILLRSRGCSRNLLRFFPMLRPHHIDLRLRGHRHS